MYWARSLIDWLILLPLTLLIGSLTVRTLVAAPAARWLGELDAAALARKLGRIGRLALGVLALATVAELVARAQVMAGGSLAAALSAVPIVLTRTHFGTLWLVRVAALAALAAPWSIRGLPLALAVLVALTVSQTGHAAEWGDWTPSVIVDWLHVTTASLWVGGLLCLTIGVFASKAAREHRACLAEVCGRFSRLAAYCVVALVASGIYNGWIQLPSLSALWTTPYGQILTAKVALVGILLAFGSANRYLVVPWLAGDMRLQKRPLVRVARVASWMALGRSRLARHAQPAALVRLVTAEAALGAFVVGATALLTQSTPPRHLSHEAHRAGLHERTAPHDHEGMHDHEGAHEMHAPAAGDGGPVSRRVSMAELHAHGGVPPGWRFEPPPGDAEAGRRLFATLGCAGCHAVRGAGLPAPTRPGPDLTGVGSHHPADYLAESIMNPNAVIVDGPGYAGPDGRSTMLDYSKTLTVQQVGDLVAYLRSLRGNTD